MTSLVRWAVAWHGAAIFLQACQCLPTPSACQHVGSQVVIFSGVVARAVPALSPEQIDARFAPLAAILEPLIEREEEGSATAAELAHGLTLARSALLEVFGEKLTPEEHKLVHAAQTLDELEEAASGIDSNRTFHFEVNEAFQGEVGSTAAVVTASHSASCGYPFEVGRRYLVYAYPDEQDGELHVSGCGATKPLELAGEDIEFFRSLDNASPNGSVFRPVMLKSCDAGNGSCTYSPVPGLGVLLIAADGSRLETSTDGDGRYEFKDLAPGDYQVQAVGRTPGGEPAPINVTEKGCRAHPILLQELR